MLDGLGGTAWIFISIFYGIILFICIGVGWIGRNLLEDLGRFPSKTPAIQMGILFKLVVLEVTGMTLLVLFFKALTSQ